MQLACRALSWAVWRLGSRKPARIPMMVMTTRSSMRVKPADRFIMDASLSARSRNRNMVFGVQSPTLLVNGRTAEITPAYCLEIRAIRNIPA